MNELNEKIETKEVVKGNSNDFVKKAEAVDKKPVAKRIIKNGNKNNISKTESKSGLDKKETQKKDKKPLTSTQSVEKKYGGSEYTWCPFKIFFDKQKEKEESEKNK